MFGLGFLAHLVSVLADRYSRWIWNQLADGAEATFDFLESLWDFGHWLVEDLAGRWYGFDQSSQLH